MISGLVNASGEATVALIMRGSSGRRQRIIAVIDTGFDGWVCLPAAMISHLALPWRRRGRALLADGRESIFDIYETTIVWDRRLRRIPVDQAETAPLIGMALLTGFELNVQVCRGGKVSIRRLPERS